MRPSTLPRPSSNALNHRVAVKYEGVYDPRQSFIDCLLYMLKKLIKTVVLFLDKVEVARVIYCSTRNRPETFTFIRLKHTWC